MTTPPVRGLIDVHTHVTPFSLPGCDTPDIAWPCMACKGAHAATLMLGDKPFRELDDRSWNVARRCEDMDRDGVAIQVLSPMPELLSYWFPAAETERMADHINAAVAEMTARNPGRFRGLGMAPLQDVERGVRCLERLRERFGLSGIEIGSNVNGVLPGDPAFAPILEAAEALDLSVFVHALHPLSTRSLGAGGEILGPLAGFPMDVALAAASLLTAGATTRWPKLRIAFSHGGGALNSVLGRLDQGWSSLPGLKDRAPTRPSEAAREFYFDSNVYDAGLLRFIGAEMAPGHVFLGTDYPYLIMQREPAKFLQAAGFGPEAHAEVAAAAALKFLGEV
jgi:aminocarboxymuconate-semialdehyde decarboxylase